MATTAHVNPTVAGFSLIELLITLSVAAIVLGISAPALQGFTARQALISASNSLVTGLQLARYQAITSGSAVRLCPAHESGGCADRTAWSHGWLVQPETSATLPVQHRGQLPAGMTVSLSQGRQHVRFLPDGRSPGTNLTLQVCSRSLAARQIIISNSGRVRSGPISTMPC